MPIDYSRYPHDWKTRIVPEVLERAGNKCEKCSLANKVELWSVPVRISINGKYKIKRLWITSDGDLERIKDISQGGEIKRVKVVLTIAHLDHDEENHDVELSRLRAWCQYCHLNYDAKEKYRRACNKAG